MDKYEIGLSTPCVYYDEDFLSPEEASDAYDELWKTTAWEKTSKINRYVALHEEPQQEHQQEQEEESHTYKYRDAPDQDESQRRPFTTTIRTICEKAETWYNNHHHPGGETPAPVKFNVCLLNFYENGSQRIGWHCDREEIGRSTPIASISLGATRQFQVRAKQGLERLTIDLTHGSLTIMENICQMQYLHCLPKMNHVTEGRINLTFRCKTAETPGEEEHERRDKWLERMTQLNEQDNDDNDDFGKVYPNQSLALQQEHGSDSNESAAVFGDIRETEEQLQDKLKIMNVVFTAKTNIGAEGYAAAEIQQLLSIRFQDNSNWTVVPRPWGAAGYVAIGTLQSPQITTDNNTNNDDSDSASQAKLSSELLKLRASIYVMQFHDRFDLADVVTHAKLENTAQVGGEELYQFYKQRLESNTARIPTLQQQPNKKKKKITFRVTCERIGERHNFQAPNVEFEIGGAMSEYFANVKPKMEDYDVNIRVDVINTHVMVGTQLNLVDLSRRHAYRFRNKVTIKTNLAYIMLQCANMQPHDTVLDPFCGSGTILLEAMEVEPTVRCIGIDVNRRSVDGARENARAVVGDNNSSNNGKFEFYCVDVRAFRKHIPEDKSIDCIVSNLPWGVQTGHKKSVTDLQSMYEIFLRTAWYTLKDHGRIVMLVLRGLQLTRILRKLGGRYRVLRANVVRTSNNLPCIVVVEKLPRDVLNDTVKGQLAYMSQFVSVSREMYQAIHHEDIADGIDVPETRPHQDSGS
ncbi:ketoglutarate-dependent dioxygenase alkB homolog 3 [Seminavis robusta]|uniref:Ketoglutarate-dependent dioxygenase alkB homolog 3 n=1 Tax=Seminavis robusta TaxID=568900 RepID=A0A9N8E1U2_9STRA|nr:ketoglutarate-dependent dioxygenase alkB homolog 3 [Seminavis robusta]|eukprot:Sro472_g149920.1 ketoglutarate-dependent dioxygenase alkB homolog 3 (749) ;mRNA; r:27458-29704